jgi:hypothetical protein
MGEDTELWGRIALKYPIAYTSKPCAKYHWIANAKATDTYIPILHHPFFTYIQQLPQYELEQYDKQEDLRLYLEYEELNMAYINLIAGNKEYLKGNLSYVKLNEFQKRKRLFVFLSILPRSLVKYIPRIKRLTLDKMRCLLS